MKTPPHRERKLSIWKTWIKPERAASNIATSQ
jgi:hypothetical protein